MSYIHLLNVLKSPNLRYQKKLQETNNFLVDCRLFVQTTRQRML